MLERNWKNSFVVIGFSLCVVFVLLSFSSCSSLGFRRQAGKLTESKGRLENFLKEGLVISGRGSVVSEFDNRKINFGFVAALREAGDVRILVSDIIGRKIARIDINGDSYAIWTREGNRRCRGAGVIECPELPFIHTKADHIDDILLAREMEGGVFTEKRRLGEGLSVLKSGVVGDSVCSYEIDYSGFKSVDRVIFPGMIKIVCSDFGYVVVLEYKRIRFNKSAMVFKNGSAYE